jgi:pyruvate formate lyase activating enzyme
MYVSRREALKNITGAIGGLAITPSLAEEPDQSHRALHWRAQDGVVQCDLCPHFCTLKKNQTGICRNRKNFDGSLRAIGYGLPCAMNVDPIEKKPLFHFLPGSRSFSIAVAGCNLRCKNCQNYSISQADPLSTGAAYRSPQSIVDEAKQSGAASIAFTYSEPVVWFEYMLDIAKLSHKKGLKNVLVSSGYINPVPFAELAGHLDGAHIDLKSFDETIYQKLNAGSLAPVLGTIQNAHKKGVWVEIVNLVVPEWSDNPGMIRNMAKWIRETVGTEVPLHFSRFYPLYKLAHLYPTSTETLIKARDTALAELLRYVYIGNVPEMDSNTYCSQCGALLVKREGYKVAVSGMNGSACSTCGNKVPGIWNA